MHETRRNYLLLCCCLALGGGIFWLSVCSATSVQPRAAVDAVVARQRYRRDSHAQAAMTQQRQPQQQQQQQQPRRRYKNNAAAQQMQQQAENSLPRNAFITIDNGLLYQDTEEQDDEETGESIYSDSAADSLMLDGGGAGFGVGAVRGGKSPYDIFTCCNEVLGSCRTTCENLSLVQLAATDANGRAFRAELKRNCPSMQAEFWGCMNRTLEAVARGTQWSGRRCCALGLLPRCRNACMLVNSIDELINAAACRQSDEQHMFACFELKQSGDRCCGNARTSECLQACRDIFEPPTPHQANNHQRLLELCGERNADVLDCVRNVTNTAPVANTHKYLPCCEFAPENECRRICRAVLNTTESTDVIIAELSTAGCPPPLPHLPLWQCFLTGARKLLVPALASAAHDVSQINQLGMDAAKLHCCEKALSAKCRRLCLQTYSNDWSASSLQFETACLLQQPELALRQCMEEVDEPCQLGCDGLAYCTNFNNRPTELFRSCSAAADEAARSDLQLWQQRGSVSLPGVNLPIKNMTRCAPARWKAIACALQVKPCTRLGHYTHICHEDCYEILSECMDWTRMASALNADAICARLRPEGDGVPCVSLRPYLEASDAPQETGGHHGLTSPCKGAPCNASEVCRVLRNESNAYQCTPGCSLGETSNYLVPFGAYVRIPVLGAKRSGSGATPSSSFKVCRCSAHGRIEHCQPLPSFSYANCVLPGGRSIKHGSSFYLECNLCSCYAEEVTCTKKQCRFPGYQDMSYTSLPCNCPTHYVPVCGRNGNTYHSACIAKCLGLQDSDMEYGACTTWQPCQDGAYNCAAGLKCLEQRKVCLSAMQRPCTQYACVNQTLSCVDVDEPVCDTQGETHRSACHLLNAGAQLAHWGSCARGCVWKGPVCGINGITYRHECAAWADYVLVDYTGRCREVGLLVHDMGSRCRTVKCSRPPSAYCRRIVPPGACCPICAGGALRVIYSRKQVDRALYALRGHNPELLTLQSVLRELDQLVQVSECQLSGYLAMEVGIFVAVTPRGVAPTHIQIEACTREAEKLSTLIESQSHQITTNLILSGLTVSYLLDASSESGGAPACTVTQTVAMLIISSVALRCRHWLWR